MFVELHPIKDHGVDLPAVCGCACFGLMLPRKILSMSIEGFEAMPDDHFYGWLGDNDDEAPFAWRDRRPTY
ncbi:MAG: hypothetical protein JXQ85_05130 [Cognatishimia sp.]|uniref:hypothetical protein n=1 Tax=Cognatishimia sp. TaxID=2211648 RepID=UPI003B8B90A2